MRGNSGSSRAICAKLPSNVRRGWASGSPLPVDANSSEARPSISRLAVWVESRETRISGEPSISVATLTNDAKGWPVLRSMVASAPARVARSRPLATAFGSKSGAGAFSGRRFGMAPGNGAAKGPKGPMPSASAMMFPFRFLTHVTPSHGNCPYFALSSHTSAPTWGLNVVVAGQVCCCGRLILEGRHADNRSGGRRPQYPHLGLNRARGGRLSHHDLHRRRLGARRLQDDVARPRHPRHQDAAHGRHGDTAAAAAKI